MYMIVVMSPFYETYCNNKVIYWKPITFCILQSKKSTAIGGNSKTSGGQGKYMNKITYFKK